MYSFSKPSHLSQFRVVSVSEQMMANAMTELLVEQSAEVQKLVEDKFPRLKNSSGKREFIISCLSSCFGAIAASNKNVHKLGARISAGCHHGSPEILVSAYVGFIALVCLVLT